MCTGPCAWKFGRAYWSLCVHSRTFPSAYVPQLVPFPSFPQRGRTVRAAEYYEIIMYEAFFGIKRPERDLESNRIGI